MEKPLIAEFAHFLSRLRLIRDTLERFKNKGALLNEGALQKFLERAKVLLEAAIESYKQSRDLLSDGFIKEDWIELFDETPPTMLKRYRLLLGEIASLISNR